MRLWEYIASEAVDTFVNRHTSGIFSEAVDKDINRHTGGSKLYMIGDSTLLSSEAVDTLIIRHTEGISRSFRGSTLMCTSLKRSRKVDT